MFLLRLRQTADQAATSRDRHVVSIELEGGPLRRTDDRRFSFALSGRDQEDLRWYLEDYLQYPLDPAPTIAARIEARMDEIGGELFGALFGGGSEIWSEVRHRLSDTRIEIASSVQEAATIPWELLRDPDAGRPLALEARSFVRGVYNSVRRPNLPQTAEAPVRVLLVICRPRGGEDVSFRSVARRLVEGLRSSDAVKLTVLRPPTFERLAAKLRDAKDAGEPFHLVHFDGHGAWSEDGPRAGGHGYLSFENAELDENRELIDGSKLGALLAETGVGALVLNACQSAYATPPSAPVANAAANVHEAVRAMGSLAQEVSDAGTPGVVAMRYSVLVETAALFMADLYRRLVRGDTLGEAVSFGRKQLDAHPRPLRDWTVPVVFEAAEFSLFPKRAKGAAPELKLAPPSAAAVEGLPPRPDAGFFGRDETLLALDRAFDRHRIVLLHAYAGSGKTAAAAEFARWYRETGGIEGPVLFTSFEQYMPLVRVLDQIGQVFGKELEQKGTHWLALDPPQRRDIALQVLRKRPVFWIWDNVEPVAGFPKGSESKWTPEEQRELAGFLLDARDTQAKFLLTSRREERDWLHDLPVHIALPPMRFHERLELARALAEKRGRRLDDVEDWRPLLDFTLGNPLTLTVLVGQALRDGLRTWEQIEAFVARLRSGEAAFQDEASEGRTRSLAASLNYGFEHAFNETEREQLALMHLFQGFVNVDALRAMGHPEADWSLPEVRGLTREDGIRLLDRAAEVGLLRASGGGYYFIHPALPWFFRRLFEQRDEEARQRAVRAYVEAIGAIGIYCHSQYEHGDRDVIGALRAEEPNLLYARALSRRNGWWSPVTSAMQGLYQLYDHAGRWAEWVRLVEEIVPEFTEPATDGPLTGREQDWSLVTGYRVRIAMQSRDWVEAERLQTLDVQWNRQRTQDANPNSVRTLAASLIELGAIQRGTGRPDFVVAYREAFDLCNRIGDQPAAAVAAFNLGHASRALMDLVEAERWYQKSLELRPTVDSLGRAQSLAQLGHVAYERFEEARRADSPPAEPLGFLNDALRFYRQALDPTPTDAVEQLAVIHNQLGSIYGDAGHLDRALHHYRESIRCKESAGNLYGAAQTRYNIALHLLGEGRFADARDYALAALRNYQTYGSRAAEKVQLTLDLIARIDKAATQPPPA